jgi:hypothetical protein
MYSATAAFITASRSATSWTQLPKLEWLNPDLTLKQDLTAEVLDGSVSVELGVESRRGFQLTLENKGGLWTPTNSPLTQPLFMNNILRISSGMVLTDGTIEYVPLGTFRVNRAMADTEARTIAVDGRDFWKDFSWGLRFTARFAPSTTLNAIIASLAANVGIISVSLDPQGDAVSLQAAPAPSLKFRRGMRVADCFTVLADDFGWEFFFDSTGTLITRPTIAIDLQTTAMTLADTETCYRRAKGGLEDSTDIFNHVGVSSTDPAISPAYGEAKDDNPSSPTWVGGSFGDRYHEEELDWVQDNGQATRAAQNILRRNLYLTHPANVDTGPLPFLDVQDVIELTDTDLKITAGRYFIDKISIPLDGSDQTMRLLEARAIGL